MATDYNLSYKGTEGDAVGTQPWDNTVWIDQNGHDTRDWDRDYRYAIVGPPRMSFGESGNRATYTFRINIDWETRPGSVMKAISNILGYSTGIGNQPRLKRTMPLKDPDGMGMVADRIVSLTYQGSSGKAPILSELYGLPDFASDYFAPFPPDRQFDDSQKAANLYTYAIIQVEFCHPLYRVWNDGRAVAERFRYAYASEQPSTEYVQVPGGQLFFSEGDFVNQKVADGGNMIRMVKTVTLHWYRLPWDVMDVYRKRWDAMMGTVNNADLPLPLYNTFYTYPKETMLFFPYRARPRLSPYGQPEYDVELTWGYRGGCFGGTTVTWNKFLTALGKYNEMGWKNGPNFVKVYTPTDHNEFDNTSDPGNPACN